MLVVKVEKERHEAWDVKITTAGIDLKNKIANKKEALRVVESRASAVERQCVAPSTVVTACKANWQHLRRSFKWRRGSYCHA